MLNMHFVLGQASTAVRMVSGKRKPFYLYSHHLILRIVILLFFNQGFTLACNHLGAESTSTIDAKRKGIKSGAAMHAPIIEQSRKLVAIPALNRTGFPELDYLGPIVSRLAVEKIAAYGFIIVREKSVRFSLQPGKKSSYSAVGGRLRLDATYVSYTRKNYAILRNERSMEISRYLKADYLLQVSFYSSKKSKKSETRIKHDPLRFVFSIYNAHDGKTNRIESLIRPREVARKLDFPVAGILKSMSILPPVPVQIETNVEGVLAYLDGHYLGKTPLDAYIVPGSYHIYLRKNGYASRKIPWRIGADENKIRFSLRALPSRAGMRITSKPLGASVYLNIRFLGKTPLSRNDLPDGAHRLRLSLKGYKDRYIGAELHTGKIFIRDVRLNKSIVASPGTMLQRKNGKLISQELLPGFTAFDLSFYSFLSALGFYGSWVVAESRTTAAENELARSLSLNLLGGPGSAGLAAVYSPMGIYLTRKNNTRVRIRRNRSRAFALLSAISLISSSIFLYLHVTDTPEMGEIGFTFGNSGAGSATRFLPERGDVHRQSRTIGKDSCCGLAIHFAF